MEPTQNETLTHLFFTRYYRATRALSKALDHAVQSENQLDMREFMVLGSICKGHNYPSAIVKRLHANKFAVTRVIQKLEEQGFLKREFDPADSRRVLLSITDAGMQARERAIAAMEARVDPIVASLGVERAELLIEALELIAEQASEVPA